MRGAYLIWQPKPGRPSWAVVGAVAFDTMAADAALAGVGGEEAETLIDAVQHGAYVDYLTTPLQNPYSEVWEEASVPPGAATMDQAAQELLQAHLAVAGAARETQDDADEEQPSPEADDDDSRPGESAPPLTEQDSALIGHKVKADMAHRPGAPDDSDDEGGSHEGTGDIVGQGLDVTVPERAKKSLEVAAERPTDGRPRILVVCGLAPDKPGSASPRFPVDNIDGVAALLTSCFTLIGPDIIVSGGMPGCELLAAKAALDLGLKLHLLLEQPTELYLKDTVAAQPEAKRWRDIVGGLLRAVRGHPALGHIVTLDLPHTQAGFRTAKQQWLDYALQLAQEQYPGEVPQMIVHGLLCWDGLARGQDDLMAYFAGCCTERGLTCQQLSTLLPA